MKNFKYLLTFFSLAILFSSCEEEKYEFGDITTPKNLQIVADIAGVDADHGRHGLLGRGGQAAGGEFGARFGGRLQQGDAGAAVGGAALQPAGLQGRHDEIGGQQDGDSLGEQEPVTLHSNRWGGAMVWKRTRKCEALAGARVWEVPLWGCHRETR